MSEPEKPELEAVAWLIEIIGKRPSATAYRALAEDAADTGSTVTDLTPLPAAQALLAQRDERIASLLEINEQYACEKNMEHEDVERLANDKVRLLERIAELEARLARWKPIARAAWRFADKMDWSYQRTPPLEWDELVQVLDALSEEGLAELLKEGSDG